MEKLKEDYINIDTRLEYMEAIAVKFVPDVDIDHLQENNISVVLSPYLYL